MEGALSKWTNVVKGWQYRWFVLDDNAGLFSYYTSKEKMMRGVRRGCVRLSGAILGIDDEDDSTFTITVDGKTFHFQAQDSEERERWIRALEDTVLRHNQTRHRHLRKKVSSSGGGGGGVRVEDFDRKLSETDIYLQMLLNQVSALNKKMEDPEMTAEAREKYAVIAEKAVNMTESIKHSIVLLQIAKNASMPPTEGAAKSASKPSSNSPTFESLKMTLSTLSPETSMIGVDNDGDDDDDDVDVVKPSPVVKKIQTSSAQKSLKTSAIPDISYSSSEDDDFYDAEDDHSIVEEEDEEEEEIVKEKSLIHVVAKNDFPAPAGDLQSAKDLVDLHSPLNADVDYDALYENSDADEEDVDMKSHGSVITHLLSQVRIGMDLTKIVLPTFILERRSLLEMYSDFFAHPDIFLEIADGKDPEERMIRVLRWYLSSFHAGRKSSVAKKPYNPILGETFRCHWKTDGFSETTAAAADDDDSSSYPVPPRPWNQSENIGPNDLTFVAEQVSHHPPISAFYAEHVKKRISVNAHIYTKSSFLGMSVAVHNVGQGTVNLLDLDEEYIATFPSAFGRSILTVPWVELGGKVNIQCPKTGYVSNIEFKCKPFFSSEVNKVTAEVFAPGSKKCVVRIDGEWNGRMMAKYASGCNEVFMDVSKIPIHKKICRKVADQEAFESRRLWREVTRGLTFGDIEAATSAKLALEQRQREEAAQRKESHVAWETKLFHPIGENWFFDEPLASRAGKK